MTDLLAPAEYALLDIGNIARVEIRNRAEAGWKLTGRLMVRGKQIVLHVTGSQLPIPEGQFLVLRVTAPPRITSIGQQPM